MHHQLRTRLLQEVRHQHSCCCSLNTACLKFESRLQCMSCGMASVNRSALPAAVARQYVQPCERHTHKKRQAMHRSWQVAQSLDTCQHAVNAQGVIRVKVLGALPVPQLLFGGLLLCVLRRCIESVIVRDKPACPLCRQPISADSLIDAPPAAAAAEAAEAAADEPVRQGGAEMVPVCMPLSLPACCAGSESLLPA
jgi:hypothetical protein